MWLNRKMLMKQLENRVQGVNVKIARFLRTAWFFRIARFFSIVKCHQIIFRALHSIALTISFLALALLCKFPSRPNLIALHFRRGSSKLDEVPKRQAGILEAMLAPMCLICGIQIYCLSKILSELGPHIVIFYHLLG